ncbi:MAG: UPF0182 family protein [Promethearchaeota archaeon]
MSRISINSNDEPRRFHYARSKGKPRIRKYLIYIIVIIAVIIAVSIFWLWPSWYADISLQAQLYSNKANADFINVYLLNFWATNFFFNKTALIGALIGSIIMAVPPDKTLLTAIGTRLGFGKPSYAKSLIFWWTAGFVIFYFLGFLLDFNATSFSWVAYLIENGDLNLTPTIISDAFSVLFNSGSKDYITIFIYGNLILPIISFTLSVVIFRVILNIVRNVYLRRNDYYALANIFIVIGLAFGLWFFSLPTQALDGINLIQIWAVIIGFISFPIFGLLIYLYGRSNYSRDSKNYILIIPKIKKIGYVGFLLMIILVIPLFISIGPAISINDTSVWEEYQWLKKYQREVEWTTDCAGLDMFEERTIENFSQSTTTSDEVMVSQVRQYDQSFAVQYIAAQYLSTFEGLADSDIVYINNKEYWVAPKTIRFTLITGDPVQRSTELLDHVEGFLAMDTFSGELVNITETFNITQNYPIFFGESESERYLQQTFGTSLQDETIGAFDSDILLETEWVGNPENFDYHYSSQPDGTLTGLEGFWKKINLGLIAYSVREENNYLINRNVKTRVNNILLPQLSIDNDPYLVFDMERGKLYYAVSIFTNINIGSYAKYPVLRFLGVCLVDVFNGDMTFYENPSLDKINDPTAKLWSIYMSNSIYDWQTISSETDWLKEQLRYPEELFEQQLAANYKYHVKKPNTWKSEVDFHERPRGGDLYYIESDLGEGVEYIGLDLVEYQGHSANILAGMYVVRHGDNFGEAIFYHTRDSPFSILGPQSANQTYTSDATQEISLIAGARNGNILLYPIGGSIYYYIPTYSTSGSLQDLKLAGFIEPFTRAVGYGADATIAYANLNITSDIGDSNLTLTYDFDIETSIDYPNDPAQFTISLQNTNNTYSLDGLDVKVNLSVYTSTTNDVNYSLLVPAYLQPLKNSTYAFLIGSDSFAGVNFTVINTTLYFGEGLELTGYLAPSIGNIIIYAKWILIVDGKIEYQSPISIILVLQ